MEPHGQSRTEVIAAYLRHVQHRRAEDAWAFDAVCDLIAQADAREGLEFVLALIHESPDEALALVAAGPLEDLVVLHGAELVELIEARAGQDARFRWALGSIWLSEEWLAAPVLERLVRARGG